MFTPSRHAVQQPQAGYITQKEKQTLIDNLQFEITEKARKMRVEYSNQAVRFRQRIERRIERIPLHLRKVKIADLLEKGPQPRPRNSTLTAGALGAQPSTSQRLPENGIRQTMTASPSRKRKSDAMNSSDKENHEAIVSPKRRMLPGQHAQRTVDPAKVLSPRSLNSRTLPHGASRPQLDTQKSHAGYSRPVSPAKPSSPTKASTLVTKTPIYGTSSTARAPLAGSRPTTAHGTGTIKKMASNNSLHSSTVKYPTLPSSGVKGGTISKRPITTRPIETKSATSTVRMQRPVPSKIDNRAPSAASTATLSTVASDTSNPGFRRAGTLHAGPDASKTNGTLSRKAGITKPTAASTASMKAGTVSSTTTGTNGKRVLRKKP